MLSPSWPESRVGPEQTRRSGGVGCTAGQPLDWRSGGYFCYDHEFARLPCHRVLCLHLQEAQWISLEAAFRSSSKGDSSRMQASACVHRQFFSYRINHENLQRQTGRRDA